ncbi:respiratory chain complex I subunit 1 family protein [Variovorax sp. PBL-E5]|uniref:respiratory chain complex I subunit 1 family protein n=1 Tax=Variovorax sp. PBL-E5 TaxID=434014 RepID=UPI00131906FF|nr:NADH-quinone oxidoreductase subunit H [Variovorax sp. PBL-E5]VTU46146.1 Hydrogenase-4 component C [Variovorax sp. PBL-E5]
MKPLLGVAHVLIALGMPVLMIGLVNRTKSLWAGRRGPRLMQLGWDLLRLLRKRPVFSAVTTPLFQFGAWVVLAASVLAAMIAPILGSIALLEFQHDFIFFAYTLALARLFLMLSAMDVGSAFEGMGAAREASFTAFVEPALFLLIGAASVATGHTSFAGLIGHLHQAESFGWLVVPAIAVLFILLQAEASRVPVDDPLTHLELTMIHEVMVLDHSGPDLAAMQYAAALKMTIYAGLIAALLNPFDPLSAPLACVFASLFIMGGVAVAVGCIESLVARLRIRWVPRYLMLASAMAALCLVGAGWLARS